jgi:hypothetical protein
MDDTALPPTSIPVRLSKETEARLTERAGEAGKPLGEYITTLIESIMSSPRTIAEISGATYQRFLESGTSDEQLSEELERAKHEMRAERRARQAS